MTNTPAQQRSRVRAPDPDRSVRRSGRQQLAVWREGHGVDLPTMPSKRVQRIPQACVPELNGLFPRSRSQRFVIRQEGCADDVPLMGLTRPGYSSLAFLIRNPTLYLLILGLSLVVFDEGRYRNLRSWTMVWHRAPCGKQFGD